MRETKFKQTEYGLIPADWVECCFANVLQTFTTGATPYRGNPENFNGNIRWITSGELNYNTIYETKEHISEGGRQNANLKVYPTGTFLMAITGLEAEGTRGRCSFIGAPSTTNQSCLAINSTDRMIVEYLYHFYCYWGDTLAFKYSQGTKQQSYTSNIVKGLPIYLPKTIAEQRKIAKALSDVDGLISSLAKLIEKKQNIKTATMQQLLTGKKRLEGFTEPWVEKKLGEMLAYEQPTNYLVNSSKYFDGGTPVLTAGKTFVLGYTDENFGIYTNLPVIIFDDFTTDSRFVDFPFKAKSSAMKMLKANSGYNIRFVFEMLQTIDYTPGDHKRHWIGMFSELSLLTPPTIDEQNAIATILSDMDTEISALETKKAKYESIKKGMMQELLTGRIRLV